MIKIVMIMPIINDYQNWNDHEHFNDDQNCNDHAHYKRWSKLKWSCTL